MNCDNCGRESAKLEEAPAANFKKNRLIVADFNIGVCELCLGQFKLREAAVEKVVGSDSTKKLIVAGPGTGKTQTFRKLVESLPEGSKVVIFTLINNLVDDLRELEQIAGREVKAFTFHAFCKSLLYQQVGGAADFSYSGTLPDLIGQDANLLGLEFEIPSERAISELREDEDSSLFYMRRADYYRVVGYLDSVYRVFTFFREHPHLIPEYALVIADEYQDFNRLEAVFIELLSTKSPVLLAGDDDQALYAFRFASHEFIRDLFGNVDFEKFNLPLCSRCPPILIEATKGFIEAAMAAGKLKGRIPKEFECYWPDKFVEHAAYPQINHAHCSTKATSEIFVEDEITKIYAADKDAIDMSKDIPFLIVGPNSRHQLKALYEHLSKEIGEDFDLDMPEKLKSQIEEGYALLRKDPRDKLGWRIVLFHSPLERSYLERIIRETFENNTELIALLPEDYVKFHLEQAEKETIEEEKKVENSEKPKVKFTTFLGAKGLSAQHVFVVGMNNGEFPENAKAPTDAEICQFIVALTRAKRSCSLVSNNRYSKELGRLIKSRSSFLGMIPKATKRTVAVRIKEGRIVRK